MSVAIATFAGHRRLKITKVAFQASYVESIGTCLFWYSCRLVGNELADECIDGAIEVLKTLKCLR